MMWMIGSVEQVRRTIADHGFLEHGKGLQDMGQGTREAFPVNRGDVVWDLERQKMGRYDGWLGRKCVVHIYWNFQLHAHWNIH